MSNQRKAEKKSSALSIILIVLAVAVLLLGYYLFFYHPSKVVKKVVDFKSTLNISQKIYDVLFTGDTVDGTRSNNGKFQIIDGDRQWTFEGFSYENGVITGTVTDMPCTVRILDQDFDVVYTGTVVNSEPAETGFFEGDGWTFDGSISGGVLTGNAVNAPVPVTMGFGEALTSYTGRVENNIIYDSISVKNVPYKYEYGDTEYVGTYSGSVFDSMSESEKKSIAGKRDADQMYFLPDIQGSFSGKEEGTDSFFNYSGAWKKGEIVKDGTFSCDNVAISFPDGSKEFGTYTGDVSSLIPNGKGSFSSINSEGKKYTYTGDFKNGMFHGKGNYQTDAPDDMDKYGEYKNGEYSPTVSEVVLSLGTKQSESFTLSDRAQAFINKHEEFFSSGSKPACRFYISKDYSYAEFLKSPEDYIESLFRQRMTVLSIEVDRDFFNRVVTTIVARDYKDKLYKGYSLRANTGLMEGGRAYVVGYPMTMVPIQNEKGKTEDAIEFLFCYYG